MKKCIVFLLSFFLVATAMLTTACTHIEGTDETTVQTEEGTEPQTVLETETPDIDISDGFDTEKANKLRITHRFSQFADLLAWHPEQTFGRPRYNLSGRASAESCMMSEYTYLFDDNYLASVFKVEDAKGNILYAHVLMDRDNQYSDEDMYTFKGKLLLSSVGSLSLDPESIQEGMSILELKETLPELAIYLPVDDDYPFGSSKYDPGYAILVLKNGYLKIYADIVGSIEDPEDLIVTQVSYYEKQRDLSEIFGPHYGDETATGTK